MAAVATGLPLALPRLLVATLAAMQCRLAALSKQLLLRPPRLAPPACRARPTL